MTRRRLAIVGDTHIDEHSRFDEHNRIMDWIRWDAAGRECCAMVHTGDVYERTSTPRERDAIASWVYSVTSRMPLVIVGGNHDNELDVELLGKLHDGGHRVQAITRPTWCSPDDTGGFWIGCLPWPRKAGLLKTMPGATHEQTDEAARLALQAILRDLGSKMLGRPDMPRVFAGHVMMRGSRVSLSQPALVGMDLELGLEDLALVDASFYALGHIHLGQEWTLGMVHDFGKETAIYTPTGGAPVVYPGSPRRCNFGEVEPKGYVVAEFEGNDLVSWERVATPCTPMLHVEGEFIGAGLVETEGSTQLSASRLKVDLPDLSSLAGAEVRLRYSVRSEWRAEAKVAAAQMADIWRRLGNAAFVKVEERVQPATRARAPEVARAATLEQKLDEYWKSQGPKAPDDEQRARLRRRLAEIGEQK
jgi:DNA repair exonuclease SbcCD nuclease subunit